MSQTRAQLISGSSSQNVSASSVVLSGSTSGTTTLAAPAVAGSNTLVLPTGNGSSGQVLSTNGSGALSWSNRPILQVVNTVKTDTFSTSSTTFTDVTGLSASITPSSASNKILIIVHLGAFNATSITYTAAFRISRNGTAVGIGDAAGTRTRASFKIGSFNVDHALPGGFSFLDSPGSTSSLSYALQITMQSPATGCINRNGSDADTSDAYAARTASTITLMEVAA